MSRQRVHGGSLAVLLLGVLMLGGAFAYQCELTTMEVAR